MWNKDERNGKAEQVKGRVKQAVGDLTGNPTLKVEGQVDEVAGKVQASVGHARRKVGDALDEMGKAAKRS